MAAKEKAPESSRLGAIRERFGTRDVNQESADQASQSGTRSESLPTRIRVSAILGTLKKKTLSSSRKTGHKELKFPPGIRLMTVKAKKPGDSG